MLLHNIDGLTFSLMIALAFVGVLMIFSVNHEEFLEVGWPGFFSTAAGKQTIWVGICAVIFTFVMLFDAKFWRAFAYSIYGFSLFLLVLVLLFGTNIKGATSWFTFGGFSFQPSEIAKFGTCLGMAAFLDTYNTDLRSARSQLTALLILLLPMSLILLQPDAGSAMVFLSFLILMYREGLSQNYYLVGGLVAALLISALALTNDFFIYLTMLLLSIGWITYLITKRSIRSTVMGGLLAAGAGAYYLTYAGFGQYVVASLAVIFLGTAYGGYRKREGRLARALIVFCLLGSGLVFASDYAFNNLLKPHQQDRINVWLNPDECDTRGSLYNLEQSKIAIGSGNIAGKGFLDGTMTKLNYVPEQSTDFIFCTIGEEQGFIGTAGIIVLFCLLLVRLITIAERQRDDFSRYYAYGVIGILFIHVFINIGMTMGLMPIIGIPLPFISKGGSSLLGFTLMLSVLLKLDKHRHRI